MRGVETTSIDGTDSHRSRWDRHPTLPLAGGESASTSLPLAGRGSAPTPLPPERGELEGGRIVLAFHSN